MGKSHDRLSLLSQAISRIAKNAFIAPFRSPRKARAYWESMLWMAANVPLPSHFGSLPLAELEQVVPEAEGIACDLRNYISLYGNVAPREMTFLMRAIRALTPQTLFEFGTFNGGTTLQMAVNSPEKARITTLDLPCDSPLRTQIEVADVTPETVGERFRSTPWAAKITTLLADSMNFDPTPYTGKMDFIFVDASHAEKYAARDTENALNMLAPGGIVFWHDYAEHAPGVAHVLENLARNIPLRHITGTSLAVHRAPPPQFQSTGGNPTRNGDGR